MTHEHKPESPEFPTRERQADLMAQCIISSGDHRNLTGFLRDHLRKAEARGAAEQRRKDAEIDKDRLADLIEGMEVSVDVSTCDEDAGHRLFGTVTVVQEYDGAKNGLILLVQEIEPNFEQRRKDREGAEPIVFLVRDRRGPPPHRWAVCAAEAVEEYKKYATVETCAAYAASPNVTALEARVHELEGVNKVWSGAAANALTWLENGRQANARDELKAALRRIAAIREGGE
ncbi:hypothetical protein [Asaia sp. HumB]|uniref:hypothetical protein n=1 Tax=Asaia sp. HumB TaxID=3035475 RepID=UPI002557168E|nr:hypothetical protein [Asaia sp. HumB]MDL2172428.1 hypothetical protein [Asaia sp. HumB]